MGDNVVWSPRVGSTGDDRFDPGQVIIKASHMNQIIDVVNAYNEGRNEATHSNVSVGDPLNSLLLTQLSGSIDNTRSEYGLSAFPWSSGFPTGSGFRFMRQWILELRKAINIDHIFLALLPTHSGDRKLGNEPVKSDAYQEALDSNPNIQSTKVGQGIGFDGLFYDVSIKRLKFDFHVFNKDLFNPITNEKLIIDTYVHNTNNRNYTIEAWQDVGGSDPWGPDNTGDHLNGLVTQIGSETTNNLNSTPEMSLTIDYTNKGTNERLWLVETDDRLKNEPGSTSSSDADAQSELSDFKVKVEF